MIFLTAAASSGMRLGKLAYGLFPLLDVGRVVVEEVVDDMDEVIGLGSVLVGDAGSGLVEDGALGGLKDDVVAGVAFVEFGFDFAVKVVFFVLGLPVPVREVELVEQSSVHAYGRVFSFDFKFGDEGKLEFASAGGKQVLEGAADGHLMVDVKLTELEQGGMVVLDPGMRRLEIELGHRSKLSGKHRERSASLRNCPSKRRSTG